MMLFILRHLSSLKQKTNKASRGAAENKTNPERKTTNIWWTQFPIARHCCFCHFHHVSRDKQLSVAACHACDSFLQSDSQCPKKVLWTIIKKYLCSSSLSLSLCLCLCPTLNPKIQGKPNGTLPCVT
jgi:hypothetical protein